MNSAAEIRSAALKALKAKLDAGKALTDADWRRLEDLAAAEQAEAPTVDQVADKLEERRAKGRAPTKALIAELRLARVEGGAEEWTDAAAMAEDLAISVQTARNWCGELSIDHARTTIAKVPVFRGLYERERQRLADARASKGNELDDQLKELRIAEKTDSLVLEAEDRARAGFISAISAAGVELKQHLAAAICEAMPALSYVEDGGAITRLIEDHIQKALQHHQVSSTPEE